MPESHLCPEPLLSSTLNEIATSLLKQLLPKNSVGDYIKAALTLLTAREAADLLPLLEPYLKQITAEFAKTRMPDKQAEPRRLCPSAYTWFAVGGNFGLGMGDPLPNCWPLLHVKLGSLHQREGRLSGRTPSEPCRHLLATDGAFHRRRNCR